MAINIKNLQERIQKKVFSVSPSTPTADLGDIVEAATLATGSLRQYDSAGLLPSVTSTQAQIAYTKKDNAIKHKSANTTTWKTLTSDAYAAGAAATAPTATIVMGTTSAFLSGGYPQVTFIDKFPLAASASSAATGGTLSVPRFQSGSVGQVSTTHGYNAGGYSPSNSAYRNDIVKYPFAISSGTSTDVGDLTNTGAMGGASSPTHGYSFGAEPQVNVIQKFSTASDGNATDVGDLFNPNKFMGGASSSTHGYSAGGRTPPPGHTDTIEKFSFTSDGNATDVGNLANPVYDTTANSSSTHGYVNGGAAIPGEQVNIIKWSFASDGNGTDVGDNTSARTNLAGHNSTEHGYASGGTSQNVIDRFPFAADGNATDVGDLRVPSTYSHNGTQN